MATGLGPSPKRKVLSPPSKQPGRLDFRKQTPNSPVRRKSLQPSAFTGSHRRRRYDEFRIQSEFLGGVYNSRK